MVVEVDNLHFKTEPAQHLERMQLFRTNARRDVPYLLCASVARTQLAKTRSALPEDKLLFNRKHDKALHAFKRTLRDTSINKFTFQVGNKQQ